MSRYYTSDADDDLPWWDGEDGKKKEKTSSSPSSGWHTFKEDASAASVRPARSYGYTPKKGEGLSSFWGNRFGGFSEWYSTKTDNLAIYSQALNTVTRLGSIIHNDDKLRFSWHDPEAAPKSEHGPRAIHIQLDKAPIASRPKGWTEAEGVDALVGDALGASAAHHVKFDVNGVQRAVGRYARDAQRAKGTSEPPSYGEILTNVEMATRYLAGVQQIRKEFPGYLGYFERDREFRHRKDKQHALELQLRNMLAVNPNEMTAAANTAIWNALAPDASQINVDPRFNELAAYMRERTEAGDTPEQVTEEVMRKLFEYTQDLRNSISAGNANKLTSKALPNGTPEEAMREQEAVEAEGAALADLNVEDAKDTCVPPNTGGTHFDKVKVASLWEKPNAVVYDRSLNKVRPLISRTREALSFRNELEFMHEYGLRRGQLDENGLSEVAFGSDRVFRVQDVISMPSVHIGILLDESGSMRGRGDDVARECAILLQQACAELPGVEVSIWGHTANYMHARTGATVFRYIERNHGDVNRLGSVVGRANNLDGFAIGYCGKRMIDDMRDGESNVLFVLSDGHPAGTAGGTSSAYGHYMGATGMQHVRDTVASCRRSGIEVFGLGMGELDMTAIQYMYGDKNGVSCTTPEELPSVLGQLLTQLLRTGHVS